MQTQSKASKSVSPLILSDSPNPPQNPTVADIRCYSSKTAANVVSVPAGSTIHYVSTQQVNHPGPTQYYLAKVPEGNDVKSWDGVGAVWFKISTTMPSVNAQKQMSWPGQSTSASFLTNHFPHDKENVVANVRCQMNTQPPTPQSRPRHPQATTSSASNTSLYTWLCKRTKRSFTLRARRSRLQMEEMEVQVRLLRSRVRIRVRIQES